MTENFEPEVINSANKLLELLLSKREVDVVGVMKAELSESEFEHNVKTLRRKLQDMGANDAVGAVRSGTGIAKDEAGLPGELGQRAIQALKKSNRIQQCGRGRGKCLVILSSLPLEGEPAAEATPTQEQAEAVEPDNVPVLLRHVRDTYRSMERQLKETNRENSNLTKKIEEMQQALEEKNEKIQELEGKAQTQAMATWQ